MLGAWFAELSENGLAKMQQILSFSTVSVGHPGDSCQMTNHESPENDRRELTFALCRLTLLLQSTGSRSSHVKCTSGIQSSWPDMLLDVLVAMQRRFRGLRVITRDSVERESSEPCLQMLISMRESGKRTKECHVQYLMRNQA